MGWGGGFWVFCFVFVCFLLFLFVCLFAFLCFVCFVLFVCFLLLFWGFCIRLFPACVSVSLK